MNRSHAASALLLAFAALAASPSARAAQSYDACTGFITTLPAVISTQGVWCLNKDLATGIAAGNAITVNTNNVTIDCNDFKLGGLSAGAGTATIGIRAENRLNVNVRNCNIRGFYSGVVIDGETSSGHVVSNNRFESNTYGAIGVSGTASTIRGNLVIDTGGSTVQAEAAAIVAFGPVDVIDNTIDGVQPAFESGGNGIGIGLSNNGGGSIRGNRIRNVGFDGAGSSFGINAVFSGRAVVSENELIATDGFSEAPRFGIACDDVLVRLRDNTLVGFTFPITDCGDAGGNDISGTFIP